MKRKKTENPNRLMGKQTGYELIEGVYHVAPLYQEQFSAIQFQQKGIEDMLAIVTHHAQVDLQKLEEIQKRIWDDLSADIGLDKEKQWLYFTDGTIREKASKDKVIK